MLKLFPWGSTEILGFKVSKVRKPPYQYEYMILTWCCRGHHRQGRPGHTGWGSGWSGSVQSSHFWRMCRASTLCWLLSLSGNGFYLNSKHFSYLVLLFSILLSPTPISASFSLNLSLLSFHCWRRVIWKLYSWKIIFEECMILHHSTDHFDIIYFGETPHKDIDIHHCWPIWK